MLNFVENLERKDLNIAGRGAGLARLYPDGVSLRVAAAELKRPTRWVHDRLRLLTLPEEVQQLAAAGLLAASACQGAGRLEDACRADRGRPQDRGSQSRNMARRLPCGTWGRSTAGSSATASRRPRSTGWSPRCSAAASPAWRRGWGPGVPGYISDAEIERDIEEAAPTGRRLLIEPVEPHMTTLADKLRMEPGIDVRRLQGRHLRLRRDREARLRDEGRAGQRRTAGNHVQRSAAHCPVGQFLSSRCPPDCSVEGGSAKGCSC